MVFNHQVFIRADGNFQLGLGHLVRCTALANMLSENFSVSFFCKEIPETVEKELYENGFKLLKIQYDEQFFEQLTNKIIVVLDGYAFDTSYQQKIKDKGCKLACIVDSTDKEIVADLIINHAPGIDKYDYKVDLYTQFALGLDYALIRPSFLEQAKKIRNFEKIDTLLICFGGSDFKNLTQYALQVAVGFSEFKKIIVITGAAYHISEKFVQVIESDNRIDHRKALNEKGMLAAMLEAEVAMVPASGILFEALAAGCLTISGYYVDNQLAIYKGFKKYASIIDAGKFSDLNKSIHEALVFRRKNTTKVIDGFSDMRFNERFNLMLC